MRLVFFGTGSFAVPALRALAPHVALVVTQPDRPTGRGMKLRPSPVRAAATELGLKTATPEKCRAPEFVAEVREIGADALVVASYGQILSNAVLDSAVRGGINLHASILPRWRGAAPIQRSILAGDAETGVTLMQMDRGMDTGDIIDVERTPIEADETYSELQDRLAEIAARMAARWMPRIVAGDYPRIPQESERATLAPKVAKEEAELRFERPADEEYRRYRAFTDSPGAFLDTAVGRIRLSRVRLADRVADLPAPGTVVSVSPELTVAFGSGALELLELQPEGKKRMSGRDLANGARLKPGNQLRRTDPPPIGRG
ncbi:MAG: methionyl-tRNA formyltransferase [Fimbriimonadaceae bacterium]